MNKKKGTFIQILLKGTRAFKSKTDKVSKENKTNTLYLLATLPFKNVLLLIALSSYRIKSVAFFDSLVHELSGINMK